MDLALGCLGRVCFHFVLLNYEHGVHFHLFDGRI
jgi:hypothetical protein